MASLIVDCCPSCGSKKKTHLEAMGGEWVGLIIPVHGRVRPNVCLSCGTVYVSKEVIDRINRRMSDGN